MPLFMDVHENLPAGASAADVAHAHEADLATQGAYGVSYIKYWVDEKDHKAFCLVQAPDAEAANRRGARPGRRPHLRSRGRVLIGHQSTERALSGVPVGTTSEPLF